MNKLLPIKETLEKDTRIVELNKKIVAMEQDGSAFLKIKQKEFDDSGCKTVDEYIKSLKVAKKNIQ